MKQEITTTEHSVLAITWYIPEQERSSFYTTIEAFLLPKLRRLYNERAIAALLPFFHKPLKNKDNNANWTDYWVIVLPDKNKPNTVWDQSIEPLLQENTLSKYALKVEVLRQQPGLDKYYPHWGKQDPVLHTIEYVLSKPETRKDYYQDQYKFSTKVIDHFWRADKVDRIIGYESTDILIDRGNLPKWDVVHIAGFRRINLIPIVWHLLRYLPLFNSFAKNIGYPSAISVLRSWEKKRQKYLIIGKQDLIHTLRLNAIDEQKH